MLAPLFRGPFSPGSCLRLSLSPVPPHPSSCLALSAPAVLSQAASPWQPFLSRVRTFAKTTGGGEGGEGGKLVGRWIWKGGWVGEARGEGLGGLGGGWGGGRVRRWVDK